MLLKKIQKGENSSNTATEVVADMHTHKGKVLKRTVGTFEITVKADGLTSLSQAQ